MLPETARKPRRIQIRRTPGWNLPGGAVDVSEGEWANPFAVGESIPRDSDLWPYVADLIPGVDAPVLPGVRLESVTITRPENAFELHFLWFLEQPHLMLTVEEELGGRDLACDCKRGVPCHAGTLLMAAAGWPEES